MLNIPTVDVIQRYKNRQHSIKYRLMEKTKIQQKRKIIPNMRKVDRLHRKSLPARE